MLLPALGLMLAATTAVPPEQALVLDIRHASAADIDALKQRDGVHWWVEMGTRLVVGGEPAAIVGLGTRGASPDGAIALDGNFNALSAKTGDGEISLTVPAGSSFTIETNSPEEISNQGFSVAEDITPSPRLKRWRIGNGGKVFVLRTGDGKILLRPR